MTEHRRRKVRELYDAVTTRYVWMTEHKSHTAGVGRYKGTTLNVRRTEQRRYAPDMGW